MHTHKKREQLPVRLYVRFTWWIDILLLMIGAIFAIPESSLQNMNGFNAPQTHQTVYPSTTLTPPTSVLSQSVAPPLIPSLSNLRVDLNLSSFRCETSIVCSQVSTCLLQIGADLYITVEAEQKHARVIAWLLNRGKVIFVSPSQTTVVFSRVNSRANRCDVYMPDINEFVGAFYLPLGHSVVAANESCAIIMDSNSIATVIVFDGNDVDTATIIKMSIDKLHPIRLRSIQLADEIGRAHV